MRFIFIVILVSNTIGFSQNTFFNNEVTTKNLQKDVIVQGSQTVCSQSNPSNGYENGVQFDVGSGYICTNDIIVASGEDLTLNQITFNRISGVPTSSDFAEISIYNDNEGLPGILLSSQIVIATTQLNTGCCFGFIVVIETYDITPVVLTGNLTSETTYWVAIQTTTNDGTPAYWEDTSATSIGNFVAFNDGSGWETIPSYDGVYSFNGDCSPILAIDIPEGFIESVIVYPTPVTTNLNLQSQNPIKSVQVFNLLGEVIFVKEENTAQIDFSNYTKGIYFVKVETDKGFVVKRVIKE